MNVCYIYLSLFLYLLGHDVTLCNILDSIRILWCVYVQTLRCQADIFGQAVWLYGARFSYMALKDDQTVWWVITIGAISHQVTKCNRLQFQLVKIGHPDHT